MTKQSKFESTLRDDLNTLEQSTGAPEVFRLAQARNRALAQQDHRPAFVWPVLGASLASLLMAVVLIKPESLPPTNHLINGIASEELLLEINEDNIELFEELDFYYWLAETDQDGIS